MTEIEPGHAVEEERPPSRVEQYVLPLLLPLLIVAGVIFYVINLSRAFLASSETVAVVIASVITVAILLGATVISNAPQMRSSSIALTTLGFLAVILMTGALTIGASKPHEENFDFPPNPLAVPEGHELAVETQGLAFTQTEFEVVTGFVDMTLTNGPPGLHTWTPESPDVLFDAGIGELVVSGDGESDAARTFIPAAGDYVFFCATPGHRTAGMVANVTVSGDDITVEEATATQLEAGAGAAAEG